MVAGSVVFSPLCHAVPLDDHFRWWSYVKGASWRHPLGPGSSIGGKGRLPVVQVAYEDAEAYARWAGKRLPTGPNGSSRREGWSTAIRATSPTKTPGPRQR